MFPSVSAFAATTSTRGSSRDHVVTATGSIHGHHHPHHPQQLKQSDSIILRGIGYSNNKSLVGPSNDVMLLPVDRQTTGSNNNKICARRDRIQDGGQRRQELLKTTSGIPDDHFRNNDRFLLTTSGPNQADLTRIAADGIHQAPARREADQGLTTELGLSPRMIPLRPRNSRSTERRHVLPPLESSYTSHSDGLIVVVV